VPSLAAPFEIVTDVNASAEALRRRRYGMIEMRAGQLHRIVLRPFPKLVSWPDLTVIGAWQHRHRTGDRCLLYYNQPRRLSNFLALKYVVSYRDATLATFRGALTVLEEIARIKATDAIVCDAANLRISDRLAERWGWEPHCPSRWHRNFIKRLYPAEKKRSKEEENKRSHFSEP
jgi:hypothetical protein